MELRRPRLADQEAVLAMMAEFEQNKSSHDGGFWNLEDFDYQQWLMDSQLAEAGIGLPENWVPNIQFVAFDDDKAIGFLNLRLALNDSLLETGGHIGYSVRPSEQGQGYATQILAEGIKQAHSKNIKRILLTCQQDNPASRQVILKNGGRLEDTRQGIERYWIGGKDE